jgi:hypothetical protein
LAFLRNGFQPAQQLLNLIQAQQQLQQNQQQQQQTAVLNSLQYLSPLQLIQNHLNGQQNALAKQQSPQRATIQPTPTQIDSTKAQKLVKPENSQFSPSLTALKLNLDHHQMHNSLQTHHDQPPLSSTTSIDESVMMTSSNSPTETVSGTVSPMHEDEHELPKEPAHASLKRPAAIQDMLMKKKKKARLDGLMDGLFNKKVIFLGVFSFFLFTLKKRLV